MAGVPTIGQANPTFPLTTALVQAGHTVDYLMPEAFRAEVENCGATLLPYANGLRGKHVSEPWQGLGARLLFTELTARVLAIGNSYDAVVATGVQPQFARMEQGLEPPVVRFSPMFWMNNATLGDLARQAKALPPPVRHALASPALRQAVSAVAGRALLGNGGRDIVDLLSPQSSTLNLTVSSRFFQPRADDFDDTCVYLGPTPAAPTKAHDFPLERLREHPGPVIYVSLGTIFNGWTGYFRRIAEAFANTDALVVITLAKPGATASIGPVADNILVFPYVPQPEVLREADLCFTHGGFGTITEAGLAGVPMVVTPLSGDQFFNAYRLLELDAAAVLTSLEVSTARLRRVAEGILESRPSGLDALSSSFTNAPGPGLGVQRIEQLLAGG